MLAVVDASDEHHARALDTMKHMADEAAGAFTTNYIEVEAHALLLCRLGRGMARQWLMTHAVPVAHATAAEEETARGLVARYADKDWSFCDAISFALMEARGVRRAFAYDRHFQQVAGIEVLG